MSANILSTGPRTRLCIESTPRDCVCHTEIQMFQSHINNSEKGRNGWTRVSVTRQPTVGQ